MGYRTVVYIADGGASSPARTVSVSQNAPFLGLPVCDLSGQLLSNFRSALLPLNYPGRVKYIMGRPFYEEESAILCFLRMFFFKYIFLSSEKSTNDDQQHCCGCLLHRCNNVRLILGTLPIFFRDAQITVLPRRILVGWVTEHFV